MKTTVENILVRSLGGFYTFEGSRRLELKWPSEKGRAIFSALLCPMDEYLHWDRLCRVIGNGAPDAEVRQDLNHELRLLAEMFREVVGCNLVVVSNCGVWLDPKIVTVDARLFRDAACNGFAAMAQGDDKRAVRLFREAGLLYRGPFLPEDAGKIVHETRVELAELMAVVADALSRECRSSCSPLSTRKFSAAPSRIAALTT